MYRAYQPELDRLVAVKVFRLDVPPERVHQLVAEFEKLIAADLSHPGIAAPLAAGIAGTSAYLAQDFVAADSLDIVVRDYGPAPAADALRVGAQLAGALDFAAVVNITHGSMHPRDVLVSSDDTRLTGTGITRALERIGVTVAARRPYTAPERIAGHAWDRRADVFSLAAVLYELLFGRRIPGPGESAGDAVTEVSGGNVRQLRAVFARALAEDPSERFDTALEFVDQLRESFGTIAVARPAAVETTAPPARGASRSERPSSAIEEPRLPLEADLEPTIADSRVEPDRTDVVIAPASSLASATPLEPVRDLDLRAAEESRYEEVEIGPDAASSDVADAPIVAARAPAIDEPASQAEPARAGAFDPSVLAPESASRSAIWPLALALVFGALLGAAMAVVLVNRARSQAEQQTAATPPSREFTESAVKPEGGSAAPRESAPALAPSAPTAPAVGEPGAAARAATTAPPPASSAPPSAAPAQRATAPSPAPNVERRERTAPAETGRLLVRSTPAGARVFVDGREIGTTPVTMHDVARGSHTVRVTHQGYVAEERRVSITAGRPAQSLTFELDPPRPAAAPTPRPAPVAPASATTDRFVGTLSVDSRPSGASVFLDGRAIGTTPLQVEAVNAGEHAIRIERDGYRRWTSSVRVVAGERNRVTASLER